MYIKDFEIIHRADDGYGYCYGPEVRLSIKDCSRYDLGIIELAATDGRRINIVGDDTLRALKRAANSTYGIPENPSIICHFRFPISNYCANDDLTIPYISLFRRSPSTDDLKVTKVIYNNPATIVFWSDGTKTVVKCGKDDTYDKEKGFYIACAKKLFGNDYKAVGRMNKALEMAEDKNGR